MFVSAGPVIADTRPFVPRFFGGLLDGFGVVKESLPSLALVFAMREVCAGKLAASIREIRASTFLPPRHKGTKEIQNLVSSCLGG
jgi:hypothetical protein